MFAQRPAVQHVTNNIGAGDFPDHQFDASVGEQNVLARLHVAREFPVSGGNELRGAHHVSRRNGDRLPSLQSDCQTVLETAGPDLRALQILQNADGASEIAGHFTQTANYSRMIFVRAVRKIEPGNVHPPQH